MHNGIIENHDELRAELQAKGYRFESQTDTEVIAHLVHSLYRGDLAEAERLCGRITILNDAKVVAEDTPEGLKALIEAPGRAATLEDVFMRYTGRSLDDDIEEDEAETD